VRRDGGGRSRRRGHDGRRAGTDAMGDPGDRRERWLRSRRVWKRASSPPLRIQGSETLPPVEFKGSELRRRRVDLLHPGASGDLEYVAGGGAGSVPRGGSGVHREVAEVVSVPGWKNGHAPFPAHLSRHPFGGQPIASGNADPCGGPEVATALRPGGGPLASGVNVLEAPLCPPQWYPQTGWSAESAQDPRKFNMGEEFFYMPI